jgi:hypothetical protein
MHVAGSPRANARACADCEALGDLLVVGPPHEPPPDQVVEQHRALDLGLLAEDHGVLGPPSICTHRTSTVSASPTVLQDGCR